METTINTTTIAKESETITLKDFFTKNDDRIVDRHLKECSHYSKIYGFTVGNEFVVSANDAFNLIHKDTVKKRIDKNDDREYIPDYDREIIFKEETICRIRIEKNFLVGTTYKKR